jgi:hypothetical protein
VPGGRPVWVVPQQVEIDKAFSIRRENELPRVAALCHMVRGVQSDDACESSHGQKYYNRTKPETSRLSPVFLRDLPLPTVIKPWGAGVGVAG